MFDYASNIVEKAVGIGGVTISVEIEGVGDGDGVVDFVASRGDALQGHD